MELYYGLLALQHRGQSSVGLITYDGNIHPKKYAGLVNRLVKNYEEEEDFGEDYPGNIGIGHTRYSTSGSDDILSLKLNAQPEYIVNPFIAACHNGNIYNSNSILPSCSRSPRTVCDVQALLLPMAQALPPYNKIDFDSIVEAGENVMSGVKGSYSTLFLTAGKDDPYLVAMTDPYKIRPLSIGRKDDTWYMASESMVLSRLGVDEFTEVDSGSIVSVAPGEEKPCSKKVINKEKHHCMFEYVYFADPVSWINGISVHNSRVALGRELAKECPANADLVVPVPESGRRYGIGFSHETGLPLEEGLKKDKKERAFILQTQDQRNKMAERNLSAVDAAVDGKNIVITDDSLIRGTNIKRVIRKLRKAGAKKIHVRIGCPPIIAPCYLGIDMRSRTEFIALDNKTNEPRDWDDIANEIGADSLGYSSIDALKRAIRGGRDDFELCTGCINFPHGYPPDLQVDVVEFLKLDAAGERAYES
jgi:amidophosphoribosyltransferase